MAGGNLTLLFKILLPAKTVQLIQYKSALTHVYNPCISCTVLYVYKLRKLNMDGFYSCVVLAS